MRKKLFQVTSAFAVFVASLTTALPAQALEFANDLAMTSWVFSSSDPLAAYATLSAEQQLAVLSVVEANPNGYVLPAKSPRGYTYYTDLSRSAAEALWCVNTYDVVTCTTANNDATTAGNDAGARFPSSLKDGSGDAYRHCLWNVLMTKHLDSGRAKTIATKHEYYHPGSAASEAMDLYNNQMGRSAALNSSTVAIATSKCYVWATDGTLKTLI